MQESNKKLHATCDEIDDESIRGLTTKLIAGKSQLTVPGLCRRLLVCPAVKDVYALFSYGKDLHGNNIACEKKGPHHPIYKAFVERVSGVIRASGFDIKGNSKFITNRTKTSLRASRKPCKKSGTPTPGAKYWQDRYESLENDVRLLQQGHQSHAVKISENTTVIGHVQHGVLGLHKQLNDGLIAIQHLANENQQIIRTLPGVAKPFPAIEPLPSTEALPNTAILYDTGIVYDLPVSDKDLEFLMTEDFNRKTPVGDGLFSSLLSSDD